MIKIYTTTVIGVDTEDNDRTLFTMRAFDEGIVELKIDTIVSTGNIGLLCDALQQAMERLELEGDT